MMRTHTSGLVPTVALLTATLAALPGLVSGQESATHASQVATAVPTAAVGPSLGDASEWKAYATRLLDEARALPAGSAESLQKIHTAAMIRFQFGEPRVALDLFVDAAEVAIRSGEVALAAHAYIDGAWIATAMKRPSRALELAESAIMLSISPLMEEVDRMAVLRRVERSIPVEANAG